MLINWYIAVVVTLMLIIKLVNAMGGCKVNTNEAELEELEYQVWEKNRLLREASVQFRSYAMKHFEKDTNEAFDKGKVNEEWADRLLEESKVD